MTTGEKNLIRQLLQGPQFQALESLKNEIIAKIESDSSLKDDLWLTGKTVAFNEGQKHGINRLFNELFNSQT